MKYFSAKTLFTLGRKDRLGPAALEERVVLIRAADADEAVRLAEKNAREYEKGLRWRNFEGVEIVGKYLETVDVFRIDEQLESGAEVYSATMLLRRRDSDRDIVERFFGPERTEEIDDILGEFEPDPEFFAGAEGLDHEP